MSVFGELSPIVSFGRFSFYYHSYCINSFSSVVKMQQLKHRSEKLQKSVRKIVFQAIDRKFTSRSLLRRPPIWGWWRLAPNRGHSTLSELGSHLGSRPPPIEAPWHWGETRGCPWGMVLLLQVFIAHWVTFKAKQNLKFSQGIRFECCRNVNVPVILLLYC